MALKAVKTETERKADETRSIKDEMMNAVRTELHRTKDQIRVLQVRESINEFLLEAIRECHENARYVKCFKNGYITGHELVHSLKNISSTLRYQLAMVLLEEAEHQIITGGK